MDLANIPLKNLSADSSVVVTLQIIRTSLKEEEEVRGEVTFGTIIIGEI